jgi:DnaJ-class molecular chaperone
MKEEKIKTVMLAGGVNKFFIYGKEFWTIPAAQAYAREVESIDWTPVGKKDEEYGNGYIQMLEGRDSYGNEWYAIGVYCFDELQRIEDINKYCPRCKGGGEIEIKEYSVMQDMALSNGRDPGEPEADGDEECPLCKGKGTYESGVIHPQTSEKEILDCPDCKGVA